MDIPPPPPGFVLETGGDIPPPPPGFVLDDPRETSLARTVGLVAKGANTGLVAQSLGALPDLIAAGMRTVGVPNSPPPGFYTGKVQQGLDYVTTLGGTLPDLQARTQGERVAQAVGQGMGQAASMMIPAQAVAQAARAGSVTQGVAQTMASNPVTQILAGGVAGGVTEITDSPTAGLIAGLVVPVAGAVAGRVAQPLRHAVDPERARLVGIAQQEGIPVPLGAQLGSRPLQTVESVFRDLPFTAGPAQAARDETSRAFTRAVMARTGTAADDALPGTLQTARDRLGQVFTDLTARNTLELTPAAQQRLVTLLDDATRNAPQDVARLVSNRIDDLMGVMQGTQVPGTAYRQLDSAIGKQISGASSGDVRNYLGQLRTIIRDAMDESISAADQAAWRDARSQYSALMSVTRAMNTPAAQSVTGQIPPSALATAVQGGQTQGYARGFGPLNELARVGKALVQDPIPNSGTAQRTMITNMLTGGGTVGAAVINPMLGAAMAAGLAAPRAAQALYGTNAVQAYLRNGMLQGVFPELNRATLGTAAAQDARRRLAN